MTQNRAQWFLQTRPLVMHLFSSLRSSRTRMPHPCMPPLDHLGSTRRRPAPIHRRSRRCPMGRLAACALFLLIVRILIPRDFSSNSSPVSCVSFFFPHLLVSGAARGVGIAMTLQREPMGSSTCSRHEHLLIPLVLRTHSGWIIYARAPPNVQKTRKPPYAPILVMNIFLFPSCCALTRLDNVCTPPSERSTGPQTRKHENTNTSTRFDILCVELRILGATDSRPTHDADSTTTSR
jgi:hypothetical protein